MVVNNWLSSSHDLLSLLVVRRKILGHLVVHRCLELKVLRRLSFVLPFIHFLVGGENLGSHRAVKFKVDRLCDDWSAHISLLVLLRLFERLKTRWSRVVKTQIRKKFRMISERRWCWESSIGLFHGDDMDSHRSPMVITVSCPCNLTLKKFRKVTSLPQQWSGECGPCLR